ncbi:ATP-binding protein [Candidatus Woesearchaeota archaeon]|nr:ATP-binding protein [Candidatus Woesearchaeota archaeon]
MVAERIIKHVGNVMGMYEGANALNWVPMPSIALVGNLETAMELEKTFPEDRLIVVHSPNYLKATGKKTRFRLGGQKIGGKLIRPALVAYNLARLYEESGGREAAAISLDSLETRISEETERRRQSQQLLAGFGQSTGEGGKQEACQIGELIRILITAQFEHLEHFITEEIQNAAAATAKMADGRIDVYLNPQERYIRVSDNGIGMSQHTIENVYFSFFKSLNELLEHAEGEFGLGAKAKFGIGHESIAIDSMPVDNDEKGGYVVVDRELQREEGLRSTRRQSHGTTVEIRLSEASTISFDRVVDTLIEDCESVKTSIYLQIGDAAPEKINKPLFTNESGSINFDEQMVQGHLRALKRGQRGKIKLTSHLIKLGEVEAAGVEGTVNCDYFNKTFSRDSVVENPVLVEALGYAKTKAAELLKSQSDGLKNSSVEARLVDYSEFLRSTLLKDGAVDKGWVVRNLEDMAREVEKPERATGLMGRLKRMGAKGGAAVVGLVGLLTIESGFDAAYTYFNISREAGVSIPAELTWLSLISGLLAGGYVEGTFAYSHLIGKISGVERRLNRFLGDSVLDYHIKQAEKEAGETLFGKFKGVEEDSMLRGVADALVPRVVQNKVGAVYNSAKAVMRNVNEDLRGFFVEWLQNYKDTVDTDALKNGLYVRESIKRVSHFLELAGIEGVKVNPYTFTNKNYKLSPGEIKIGRYGSESPWKIAMAYATDVLKDLGAARRIADAVTGVEKK